MFFVLRILLEELRTLKELVIFKLLLEL